MICISARWDSARGKVASVVGDAPGAGCPGLHPSSVAANRADLLRCSTSPPTPPRPLAEYFSGRGGHPGGV